MTKRPYKKKEIGAHWNGRDRSQGRQTSKRRDVDHRRKNCRKEIVRLKHHGIETAVSTETKPPRAQAKKSKKPQGATRHGDKENDPQPKKRTGQRTATPQKRGRPRERERRRR